MIDNQKWLDQVSETPLDPSREIIDPHHHLWGRAGARAGKSDRWIYTLPELWLDTNSGHNIVKTLFIECNTAYRKTGAAHLRPLGETEYVMEHAQKSQAQTSKAVISGIVAFADLTSPHLDEILDGHLALAGNLFKGIRHAGAYDPHGETLSILNNQPPDLFLQATFQQGVRRLGALGLSYDSWHYHPQNADFLALAQACPDTTFILDHFGTPLGVGRFKNKHDEIFPSWCDDMAKLAAQPNVYAKLGGLAMPDNGFYFHKRELPPTSDELVATQGRYYNHMIKTFTPARCMFESNFPVDRLSVSYNIYWNAMKKIAAPLSEAEKHNLFYGTAALVYKL